MTPSIRPFLLIFTDLDGTLLDHETYRWKDAGPALALCRQKHIPVILISSKTRAEMLVLRRDLSLDTPFVSENGGGIFFSPNPHTIPPEGASKVRLDPDPAGSGRETGEDQNLCLWKVDLGMPYDRVVKVFQEIREELRWNLRGFSDMDVEEIARMTGLDSASARRSATREYDEPFLVPEGPDPVDLGLLSQAASKRGLRVTRGGRFFHLQGQHHKGKAMQQIKRWYEKIRHAPAVAMALGDSYNDLEMLEQADVPVLVRSSRPFPEAKRRIPKLETTRDPGPKGWNTSVIALVKRMEMEEPHE